jgi:hypothetical protein
VFKVSTGGKEYDDMKEGDWIYIPEKTVYSITCVAEGAIITGYGMACECKEV